VFRTVSKMKKTKTPKQTVPSKFLEICLPNTPSQRFVSKGGFQTQPREAILPQIRQYEERLEKSRVAARKSDLKLPFLTPQSLIQDSAMNDYQCSRSMDDSISNSIRKGAQFPDPQESFEENACSPSATFGSLSDLDDFKRKHDSENESMQSETKFYSKIGRSLQCLERAIGNGAPGSKSALLNVQSKVVFDS
jgi:hypothetical protein